MPISRNWQGQELAPGRWVLSCPVGSRVICAGPLPTATGVQAVPLELGTAKKAGETMPGFPGLRQLPLVTHIV